MESTEGNIGELRLSAGLTVSRLAELAGVSRNTISKAENGGAVSKLSRRKILQVLEGVETINKDFPVPKSGTSFLSADLNGLMSLSFSLSEMHRYGSAFFEYLALRKLMFVDQLGWSIPHDPLYEMDQYDNPYAQYVLISRGNAIVSGARLTPGPSTTARPWISRNPSDGGLIEVDPNTVSPSKRSDTIELSRLVVSDDLTSNAERLACLRLIFDAALENCREKKSSRLLALAPINLVKTLNHLELTVEQLSDIHVDSKDRRKYAILSVNVQGQEMHKGVPTRTLQSSKPAQ